MRNSGQISLVLANGETYSQSGGIRVGSPAHGMTGDAVTNQTTNGNAVMDISGRGIYATSQVHVGRGNTGNGHLTIGEDIDMRVSTEFWVARDPSGGTTPTGVADLHGTLEIYGSGNRQIDIGWGATGNSGTFNIHPTARVFGSIHRFSIGRTGAAGVLNVHGEIEFTADGENSVSGNREFEIGDGAGTQGTVNLYEGSSMKNVRRLWVGRTGGKGALDVRGAVTFSDITTGTFRELVLGNGSVTVDEVPHISEGTLTVHEGGSIGGGLARLWVGESGGTGILHLNGGTITKPAGDSSVIIGQAGGNGTVDHDSGTFTTNQHLMVGNQGNATGVYHMRGGQLTVTGTGAGANSGLVIGRTDGTHGTGTFNLSGGTVTTTPVMIAGAGGAAGATAASESTGHLAITGGELQVSRIFGGMGSSSALFNGGRITVTGASTSENQFMQDIKAATVGANGLNVDLNGFDVHLSQRFAFQGQGVIAFSNSSSTPGVAAFHGLQDATLDEGLAYGFRVGNRVTLDLPVGGTENRDLTRTLDGSGALRKSGSGTLNVIDNAYTGDTTVAGGTLVLVNPSLGDTSTVTVADGAVLQLFHSQTDVIGALILNGIAQEPGIYNQGNSNGLIAGTGSLHVIPPAPPAGFAGFMDGYIDDLPDEADREAGADPDGDGITNLMEYALGLDPTVPGSLPSLVGNTITFAKGDLAVENDDVTYIIETSPTLGAEPTPWVAVTPTVDNDEEVSYTLPAASPGSPRNFVRLRVELAD